jgi:hypothetical protein
MTNLFLLLLTLLAISNERVYERNPLFLSSDKCIATRPVLPTEIRQFLLMGTQSLM